VIFLAFERLATRLKARTGAAIAADSANVTPS